MKNGLEIVPVKWIDEVLDVALEQPISPPAAPVTHAEDMPVHEVPVGHASVEVTH